MIYLGPAGIPTLCKERTTIGGIRCVAELKLNSMECEFVRGVGMSNEMAEEAGKVAEELGVILSVHCPYFINLCSQDPEKLEASKKRILDSVERAHHMGADVAVFHPGFYGKLSAEQAYLAVEQACEDIIARAASKGINDVRLGLETTGKQGTFGTLEEIIAICRGTKGCTPVVDWSHLYARGGGKIDYREIFEKLKPLRLKHLHSHFTGVEFSVVGENRGNEKRHLELKSNKPPFEPLAGEILKAKMDVTVISESPILERDSLAMKEVFKKIGYEF